VVEAKIDGSTCPDCIEGVGNLDKVMCAKIIKFARYVIGADKIIRFCSRRATSKPRFKMFLSSPSYCFVVLELCPSNRSKPFSNKNLRDWVNEQFEEIMVGSSSTGDGRKVNEEPGTIHGDEVTHHVAEAPESTEDTVTLPSTINGDEEPTTTRQFKVGVLEVSTDVYDNPLEDINYSSVITPFVRKNASQPSSQQRCATKSAKTMGDTQ